METSPETMAVTVRSRSLYVCGWGGDRVKLIYQSTLAAPSPDERRLTISRLSALPCRLTA